MPCSVAKKKKKKLRWDYIDSCFLVLKKQYIKTLNFLLLGYFRMTPLLKKKESSKVVYEVMLEDFHKSVTELL